jgi:hypothetical protein
MCKIIPKSSKNEQYLEVKFLKLSYFNYFLY